MCYTLRGPARVKWYRMHIYDRTHRVTLISTLHNNPTKASAYSSKQNAAMTMPRQALDPYFLMLFQHSDL